MEQEPELTPTHYEILKVDQMATSFEIVQAFTKRMNQLDSDTVTEDRAQIREAYDVLSNLLSRDAYDDYLIAEGRFELPFDDDPFYAPTDDEDYDSYQDNRAYSDDMPTTSLGDLLREDGELAFDAKHFDNPLYDYGQDNDYQADYAPHQAQESQEIYQPEPPAQHRYSERLIIVTSILIILYVIGSSI